MRTRQKGGLTQRTEPGWLVDEVYNSSTGNWDFYQRANWPRNPINSGAVEIMVDDDSKRHGKLKRTRNCNHTTYEYMDGSSEFRYYLNSSKTYRRTAVQGGAAYFGDLSLPKDLGAVHKEALTFFAAGCTKMEFQLGVDLLEWRETVNLVKSLTPKLKSLKNLIREWSKLSAWTNYLRSLEISVRELTFKDVANYHLAYSFGVKPLYEDCKALMRSLKGLEAKIQWLREHSGKPVKVKFSKDLSKSLKPSDSTSRVDYETTTLRIRHFECRYKAFALIRYDVSQLNTLELALRVLTRSFGMDAFLGMAWESLPYSFVVDWVFRVGDWLDQFDSHVSIPYIFEDVGWSINMVEDRCKTLDYPYAWGSPTQVAYGLRRTRYYREAGLPVSFSSVELGKPGLDQLVLALSLCIQKIHK